MIGYLACDMSEWRKGSSGQRSSGYQLKRMNHDTKLLQLLQLSHKLTSTYGGTETLWTIVTYI